MSAIRPAYSIVDQYYKQGGLQLFSRYCLKSGSQTAARGTRPLKRTVLKKNLFTTLNARNPAGSFSNVIRTWKIAVHTNLKNVRKVNVRYPTCL